MRVVTFIIQPGHSFVINHGMNYYKFSNQALIAAIWKDTNIQDQTNVILVGDVNQIEVTTTISDDFLESIKEMYKEQSDSN